MKNGFYFKSEIISAEYFLLKKLQLIEMSGQIIELSSLAPHFYFNETRHTCSSLFDYQKSSDFVLVFNSITQDRLHALDQFLKENEQQKILFVAHILFDYQIALESILQVIDPERVFVLVENQKHPYIVSESDIKSLKIQAFKSENILVYNKKSIKIKQPVPNPFYVLLRYFLFFIFKLLLKPRQFFHDFFSTYNLRFIFGQIKVFLIKCYFSLRHITVMSMIRLFYGLKVILIRSFIAVFNYSRGYSIWVYYRTRSLFNIIRYGLVCFYYLNKEYTFYPFRKIFWFLEFQYQKRILKRKL